MNRTLVLAVCLATLLLAGCAQTTSPEADNPSSNGVETPTPSATPAPTGSAIGSDEVSFTYHCWVDPGDGSRVEIDGEFASLEDAWAHEPATISCMALKHGTEYTDAQREAIAIAGDVLPGGLDQLDSLYSQCAQHDNGYLHLTSLAENQARDVSAFLSLCPNHPGADTLQSLLAP